MKAMITGGTGFVGTHLTGALLDSGWNVTTTGRSENSIYSGKKGFTHLVCDTTLKGEWQSEVSRMDVIINLAGKNIFTLWNEEKKKNILESRVLTTQNLVEGMKGGAVKVFLSTSASGYYGDRGNEILTESTSKGAGFLSDVCQAWETEALKAQQFDVRTLLMRFGMILGKDGGAFKMMKTPFKLGLGGNLGSGQHWMAWMHIHDLVRAVLFLINHDKAAGIINFSAPQAVRNKTFTKAIAQALSRPAFFHTPGFILRLIMGELGDVLLGSQRMATGELERLGFKFTHADIDSALGDLVR